MYVEPLGSKFYIYIYPMVEDIDTMHVTRDLMVVCYISSFLTTMVVFIKLFKEDEIMGLWYKVTS